jgi:hypothetical protein
MRAGLDFKFLVSIHVGVQNGSGVIVGIVVNAIEHEVVEISASPVSHEVSAFPFVGVVAPLIFEPSVAFATPVVRLTSET